MQPILEIKAFFFNAKTDYLPYYKQFKFDLEKVDSVEQLKVKDILAYIKSKNEDFSYPEENLYFKINNLIVNGEQNLNEVIESLGTSLQIDSLRNYRSNNGLIINDDDFMKSYELLSSFATEKDLEYYKTLYALHYGSETENFDHDYIGDATLLLAHKMIKENEEDEEKKEAILKAITTPYSGLLDCEYENNLFNAQDHTAVIEELKSMVKIDVSDKPTYIDMLTSRIAKIKNDIFNKKEEELNIVVNTEGKKIAYYAGATSDNTDAMHQKIKDLVLFSRANKLSGLSLLSDSKKLAFTKAGTTLLDALDSGAQVLIVEEQEVYNMFINNFSTIEKTMGRDIDIELIIAKDFFA